MAKNKKNKRTMYYIVAGLIVAILVLILLFGRGCTPQQALPGGTSGGGTTPTPSPSGCPTCPEPTTVHDECANCQAVWSAYGYWNCVGECDNGGSCTFAELPSQYQLMIVGGYYTNPYEEPQCTCPNPSTNNCQLTGGITSAPVCSGTCPQGQECLSDGRTCSCQSEQLSCSSIIPFSASDCGQGYCSNGGRCGFIESYGGQGIGYCYCSFLI